MGGLSVWHWLIVLVVLVVLFGAKRLPDASRSLGRSLRIFKSEMQEMGSDGKKQDADDQHQEAAKPSGAPQQLPPAPRPSTQHVQAERIEKAS